jgi:hypothetical protein
VSPPASGENVETPVFRSSAAARRNGAATVSVYVLVEYR